MKEDDNLLQSIILDIENCNVQKTDRRSDNEAFELRYERVLATNLSGGMSTLLVRGLLNKLNIDEHRIFKWRLENKYWQYQILNYYIPGCMAETISFSRLLNKKNGVQKIKELCKNGFFVKAALGDSSGRNNNFDKTDGLDDIIRLHKLEYDHQEKWILQKKLNLKNEFRIHTFGKDFINGLTFTTGGPYLPESHDAEEFVKEILKKLPDAILEGTLIGWDIGITDVNECYVIEANVTGFHPEFNRGFQTSGYFGDHKYGAVLCAWLNNYFKSNYHSYINSVENMLFINSEFYRDFIFYVSIFNNEHLEILRDRTKHSTISAIIYLSGEISRELITLLDYFDTQNFFEKYYLIVKEEHLLATASMFSENPDVNILVEDSLFTKDEYKLIKEEKYEIRKNTCYKQAMAEIKAESYFTL